MTEWQVIFMLRLEPQVATEEIWSQWHQQYNQAGDRAVCVDEVTWERIPPTTPVQQWQGVAAWQKMYELYPIAWETDPAVRRAYREVVASQNALFWRPLREPGAFERLRQLARDGLEPARFCAFADENGQHGVLMDGNHRFTYANFLLQRGIPIANGFQKVTLDLFLIRDVEHIIPRDYPR